MFPVSALGDPRILLDRMFVIGRNYLELFRFQCPKLAHIPIVTPVAKPLEGKKQRVHLGTVTATDMAIEDLHV